MQRTAIAAKWFEITVYYLRRSENSNAVRRSYHKRTVGFSSTQELARRKALGHELTKGLLEIHWSDIESSGAMNAFFVIHPRTILLDQNRKTFGRVVSDQEARIDFKETLRKRKRKTTR